MTVLIIIWSLLAVLLAPWTACRTTVRPGTATLAVYGIVPVSPGDWAPHPGVWR
ncbi:MAG: hypothetical protein ACYCVZ_09950 [Streptosporangiaceae bacterium]